MNHHLVDDPAYSVSEITKGVFSLTLLISLADGSSFWLTGILDPQKKKEDKQQFWEELTELSYLCSDYCLLGGDFDTIR